MSVKEDKVKTNSISFSDQISSRLHRWVQRTSSKVRNEKERSVRTHHRKENEDVEENEMDIKRCAPSQDLARNSRESRSYDELEKALKDLINNCVTSSSVIQESRSPVTVEPDENANINITRENNNTEHRPTNKTNNDIGVNDHFETAKNSNGGAEIVSTSRTASLQESDNSLETKLASLPHCEDKQIDVGKNLTERLGNVSLAKDEIIEQDVELLSSRKNRRNSEAEMTFCNDSNHSSKSAKTCGINTSLSNVNKGLNTGSNIKQRNFDNLTLSSPRMREKSARKLDKKPPLRRIQSEGDALELKLSFEDSDVTEFAATCIRHAQKKRFSDITPMLRKPDFYSDSIGAINDNSFKYFAPKDEVLKPIVSTDMLEHESFILEMNSSETDGQSTSQTEHIPLSDRPSSLSYPLEIPKRIPNSNKSSSLKNKSSKHSPSTFPRSTPSPKFRKFPCQPVFYVPKPTESRTVPKKTRSESIGEQSKVEYLI